ncbi:hypothetical protein NEF87_000470 [Candidatus Lokiarchaeum ossiferum]|uniref:Uncharacterized protein n=1 Tax=Candidatus Lokiarchaeum ossiferum TaxID=2951803 RepID=A0ABY6HKY6_9ARCH|nr:hypothetical protein NEF87_000470 [Candidatus Lokiarchaeum sp. B-35]
MSKTAVPVNNESFTVKFWKNLIDYYFEMPNLWTEEFLSLKNFSHFQSKIIGQSLKDCSKYRSDKATNIRNVWGEILKELPKLDQRLGQIIYRYIKTKVKQNIETINASKFGFEKEFDAQLLMENQTIDSHFSNINKESLKKGEFISTEHQDLLPATLTIETDQESREINIQLMQVLHKVFISKISKENRRNAQKFFDSMLEGYKIWETQNQGKKNFISRSKDQYKKLKKNLNILKEYLTSGELKDIYSELVETLNKTSYKGASFPSFPGIIRKEDLQHAPPTNLDLFQFIIPAFGMGWDFNKNIYLNFIGINQVLLEIQRELEEEDPNSSKLQKIKEIQTKLVQFFSRNYIIDISDFSPDDLMAIYAIMEDSGKQKEIFGEICSEYRTSIDGIQLFDIQFGRNNYPLEIETSNEITNNTLNVFIMVNNWGKSKEFPWKDGVNNILPDMLLTLLANAGIWPSKIAVYVKSMDFELAQDERWDYEKRIYRILKSILDGTILKVLMDLGGKENRNIDQEMIRLNSNDDILVIPILNQLSSKLGKKSNLHRYYYELIEVTTILNRIIDHKEFGPSENFSSKNMCLTHIQEKIINSIQSQDEKNCFIIQMFNRLFDMKNLFETNNMWNKFNENEQKMILQLFNEKFSQNFEFHDVYDVSYSSQEENLKLRASLFETKSGTKKILPYYYIIHRILRIRAKDTPLLDFLKGCENDSIDLFEQKIKEYFDDPLTKKALTYLPGIFVKPGALFPRLMNTSSSLRKNFGLGLHLKFKEEKTTYSDVLVINIEGTTLNSNQFDENQQERIIRISVYQYSLKKKPRVIFDEFFFKNSTKEVDYDKIIENTVISTCASTNIPIIVRAKNRSKSGDWLANKVDTEEISKNALINNETWRDFIRYSRSKGNQDKNIPLVGYIKNYVPIPYVKLKSSNSSVRVLKLKFISQFVEQTEMEEYESFIYLIFKGTDQKGTNLLYAHASALLSFTKKGDALTNSEENNIFDLLILSAALGDEKRSIGLSGLERLFVYPYTDVSFRIYGPAIFLYGLEAITYAKRNEYE